jgi:hypothetical protein
MSAQGSLDIAANASDQEAASLVDAMPPRIQVHDAQFRMVAKGFGALNGKFDPGLYLVRVELGNNPFEQVVRVPAAGTASVTYPAGSQPLSSSAAVVHGSSSLHEYTGDYTRTLSSTKADLMLGSGARLVVLASRQDPAEHSPIKFQGVRLLDGVGKCIADLARRSPVKGPTDPNLAIAFAAEVNPGGLVLEWQEDAMSSYWRQALWIPGGYVMLIFVTVPPESSVPQIASASIHLASLHDGFEPRDGFGPATEVALESLKTRRQLLSEGRLRDLLRAKFNNPMLGIYGGHMVLQHSISNEEKIEILTEVLDNLDSLIPGSPDVVALRLMSSRLQGSVPINRQACSWPPMIRLGYVAFRDSDWNEPGVFIQSGSLADRIRTGLGSGGIWSKWAAERNSRTEFPSSDPTQLIQLIMSRLGQSAKGIDPSPPGASKPAFSHIIAHAARVLGTQMLEGVAPTLFGPGEAFEKPNLGDIAVELRSALQKQPAEIERSDAESLAWTGLNKKQAQEVENLLLSSLSKHQPSQRTEIDA